MTINIAYCLDDNFAEFTAVSIASVLANTKSEVKIHLINERLSNETVNALKSVCDLPNCELEFVNFSLSTNEYKLNGNQTIATYYKCFLQDILFNDDRVIYIDGDTVVRGDIRELWNVDLKGKAAGVTPTSVGYEAVDADGILRRGATYFNSGVMLLDLRRLREIEFSKCVLELSQELLDVSRLRERHFCREQDVLNYKLAKDEEIVFIDPTFNSEDATFLREFRDATCAPRGITLNQYRSVLFDPFIVHYIAYPKPNVVTHPMLAPSWYEYYKYKRLTPYYSINDDEKFQEIKGWEQLAYDTCLMPYKLQIRTFLPQILQNEIIEIRDKAKGKRLCLFNPSAFSAYIVAFFAESGLRFDSIAGVNAEKVDSGFFETQFITDEELSRNKNKYYPVVGGSLYLECIRAVNDLKKLGFNRNEFCDVFAKISNNYCLECRKAFSIADVDLFLAAGTESVAIFGAGKVSDNLITKIDPQYRPQVKYIVVSDTSVNPSRFKGISVIGRTELENSGNKFRLIVAVADYKSLIETLKKNIYSEVIVVSDPSLK